MNYSVVQERINHAQKLQFLRELKQDGVFIQYCPQRGYVYEILQNIYGHLNRLLVGLKNGQILVLEMDRVEKLA